MNEVRGPATPGSLEAAAVDPDRSSRRARRIALSVIGVVLLALLGAWGRLLVVDAPLPDDSDLLHIPVEDIAPEENGWTVLVERTAELARIDVLQWFREQPSSPLIDAGDLTFVRERSAEWAGSSTAAAAHEFLRSLEGTFAQIDQLAARPRVVIPFDPEALSWGGGLTSLRSLERCLEFRSHVAVMEGRNDDAIDDCLRRLSLGTRFRTADNGAIIHRAMGAAEEKAAVAALLGHIGGSPLDGERLARVAEALTEPPGSEAAFEDAFRLEYTALRNAILATPRSAAYKPHRTLAQLAERRREQIRALGLPSAERGAILERAEPRTWMRILGILGGNANGDLLVGLVPDLGSVLEHYDSAIFVRRATALAIALLRYRLREGSLPLTLDPLVPDFLAELPSDPFTGGPIRYDPVRAILWSPGSDGIDRGGIVGELLESDPAEPTVRIPAP